MEEKGVSKSLLYVPYLSQQELTDILFLRQPSEEMKTYGEMVAWGLAGTGGGGYFPSQTLLDYLIYYHVHKLTEIKVY